MMSIDANSLADRIFRSATLEGMADENGVPGEEYYEMYRELALGGAKNIITGCTYVSREGRMVQPGQAGIDSDAGIPGYLRVTDAVHQYRARIYLQISHAGRQTSSLVTGKPVVGASARRSAYFRSRPKQLETREIKSVIESYAGAAARARAAGFDGVQIHAAHGYLAHQFLHPGINNRGDEYGINARTGIGERFLTEVISAVRARCGERYPILVKVSASDELPRPFSAADFIALVKVLDRERVAAIEISYGTMEDALNIFRGQSIPIEAILRHNFRYRTDKPAVRTVWRWIALPILRRRVKGFSENYNLPHAETAKRHTDIPIISVGGFRSGRQILRALESGGTDYVSLCRPLLREPDFIGRICADPDHDSLCVNCNLCAIMCDSNGPTRCYGKRA
jgi:2,4-dienoyl-CoA reductase-like NADH-dependent reductase (Old Yellow Enzyme family)